MNELKNWLMEEESGQGMVEYALIIVLVAVVAVATLTTLGGDISGIFGNISNSLNPTSGGAT